MSLRVVCFDHKKKKEKKKKRNEDRFASHEMVHMIIMLPIRNCCFCFDNDPVKQALSLCYYLKPVLLT